MIEFLTSTPSEDFGLLNLSGWIHDLTLKFTGYLQNILLTSPTIFIETNEFWRVYRKVTKLSILVLAYVFIRVSIMKILGKKVDIDGLFSRLFTYILLTRVGPHLMIIVIDFFNQIVAELIEFQQILKPESHSDLSLIIFLIIFIVMVVRLILWYFERMILLLLYTLLIPLILSLRCTHAYFDVGNKLVKDIRDLLVTQVVHSLILLILGSVVMAASGLNPVFRLGCQIGSLSLMNKIESKVVEFLSGVNIRGFDESLKKYKDLYQEGSKAKNWVLKLKNWVLG